jgi:cyclohexyl-isocyanide hydratase
MPVEIGLLVFPDVQQLDMTGPYDVFASWPEARVRLVWKDHAPVVSSTGLRLEPQGCELKLTAINGLRFP